MKHNSFNPLFEDHYASKIMDSVEQSQRDDYNETADQDPREDAAFQNAVSDDCKASNRPSFRTLENERNRNNKTTTQYSNLMLNTDSAGDLHNPSFLSGAELR